MQRVTPGVGAAFVPVEEALREVFVSALFRGLSKGLPTRENTRLPAKQAGLALPDPVTHGQLSPPKTGQLIGRSKYDLAPESRD